MSDGELVLKIVVVDVLSRELGMRIAIFVLVTGCFVGCGRTSIDSTQPSGAAGAASMQEEPSALRHSPAETLNSNPGRFVNVTDQAGLRTFLYSGGKQKNHILESVGTGCAWLDYDEDGLLDLLLINAWEIDDTAREFGRKGRPALYRNRGNGEFEEVSDQANIRSEAWGCGVCVADYDNDGHIDIYMTNFGENLLYRNRGNGTFEEVASKSGVSSPGWSSGSAFFDADRDGWLDLYVAKYIECTFEDVLSAERTTDWQGSAKVMAGPFGLRGGKDRFYHNNRDGTFTEITEQVGMADVAESYGLGVLASDFDNDGDVDVYVANDSNPNFLYRNDGGGTFTETSGWSGAGITADGRSQGSMGVDAADFDGDGLQEIFVTNFAQDYCTLYKNEGGLFFSDISLQTDLKAITYAQLSWGCAFLDYDLDARLDLFILNGHIYPQVDEHPKLREAYKQMPTLLRNVDGELVDVSREAGPGMQIAQSMRGLALGDYDDDGKLDFLITAMDAPPLLLHNESTTENHWLKVRILNRYGSPAINATARVTTSDGTQMREVRSGSTYCSQNSFDLHFGVASSKKIETVEVCWASGRTAAKKDVQADRVVTFQE